MNKRDFREDMDRQMANVTLPEERRRAILRQAAGKRRLVRPGRLVLAAGLACLLTFGAVAAAVPSVRQLLAEALGGFSDKSQTITGVADRDNGIEVRAVSALSDGSYAKIYLEVQDLTGDRLADEVRLGGENALGWHIDLPRVDSVGVWGQKFLGYDPDTKTALLELSVGGDTGADEVTAKLSIAGLVTGHTNVSAPLPQTLTAEVRATKALADGTTVLVPEQTPAPLEGTADMRLSSMGFGNDGALHIQVALGERVQPDSASLLYTVRGSKGEDDRAFNQEFREGTFEQDGVWYFDMAITGGTPDDLPDLYVDELYGSYNTRPVITGEWTLDIPLRHQPEAAYAPHATVGLVEITKVTVSSLSVSVVGENNSNFCFGALEQSVTLRDGTEIKLDRGNNILSYYQGAAEGEASGHSFDQWMLPEPIDPADVTAITLGGVKIPLQ